MPEGRDLGVREILMREAAEAEREACCRDVCHRCAKGVEAVFDEDSGRWGHPAERRALAPEQYDPNRLEYCGAWEIRRRADARE